jgi:inner membrane protein
MMAGSHAALGAAAWLVVAPHLDLPAAAPLSLGLAMAGALMPDVDHPKSWVGRRIAPISTIIAKLLGHRGITHSLVAVAACAWLLHMEGLAPSFVAPIIVGYLSHLGADLLTAGGLRLAWPFKGSWGLPLCHTGSAFEPVLVGAVLLCAWCAAGPARIGEQLRAEVCQVGLERLAFCAGPQPRPGDGP